MNKKQQVSLFSFLFLLVLLYLFGKTKDPALANNIVTDRSDSEISKDFDRNAYLALVNDKLTDRQLKTITRLDSQLESAQTESERIAYLDSIIRIYTEQKHFLAAYEYEAQKAGIVNEADQWKLTGDAYRFLLSNPGLPEPMMRYIRTKAIGAYQESLEIDPANLDVKIQLASVYLENDNQVMNGVQILLAVIAEDKNNEQANLLLGKYGVISGQFEKAINRLENVVSSHPENAEALFLLAEAYNGSGNKEKAVELFEQCKLLINNEAFRKEIDSYIESINN